MKKFLVAVLIVFNFGPGLAQAAHLHKEKIYQQAWSQAHGGQTEVILEDRTRVDCVIPFRNFTCILREPHKSGDGGYAVEFDFAPHWAEAIGQALYYARETGLRPGVVLIMEHPENDKRYLKRLRAVARRRHIKVWTMTPSDLKGR